MRIEWVAGLVLAGAFAVVGCSGAVETTQQEDSQGDVSEEAYGSGIGKKLGGDYVAKAAAYPTLSLDAAKQTYVWDTGIRCVRAPCPSGETGRWALYKASYGNRYYAGLTPSGGAGTKRWFRVSFDAKGAVSELDGVWGETQVFVPRAKTSACAAVLCAPGTTCQESGGQAKCVPDVVAGCAAMLCAPDTFCVEDARGQGSCKPYATCRATKCGGGNFCADRPIQCFAAPCPPTAPSCEACPPAGNIDCMPSVPKERQALCSAHESISANCPGVTFTF